MAPTFTQVLAAEVARMQHLHPEREGELARAHALILHGMVLPSADDPDTGQVLSSDGHKHYNVNGTCDCTAGQHGKGCKHLHAWRLYKYVSKKVEAQAVPEPTDIVVDNKNSPAPLPEAPSSANVRVLISGHEVQFTMRGTSDEAVLTRLQALLKRSDVRPLPKPQPRRWRGGNA